MKKISFFIGFIFFFRIETQAQVSIHLTFENTSDSLLFHKINANFPKNATDSAAAVRILRGVLQQLHAQSLLEASLDSLYYFSKIIVAKWHIGKPYTWANLRNGNVNGDYLSQVGYRERLFERKPF